MSFSLLFEDIKIKMQRNIFLFVQYGFVVCGVGCEMGCGACVSDSRRTAWLEGVLRMGSEENCHIELNNRQEHCNIAI